ncbi:MAG: hypothetical protein QXR38_01145, partial [Nitrososphaerales archaeon]
MITAIIEEFMMTDNVLEAVLREVKLIRSKVERLESLIEERIIGLDEPLGDEVKAIKEYLKAKEKGEVEYIPLEEV